MCSAHTGKKKGHAKSETTLHMTRIVLTVNPKGKTDYSYKAPHYTYATERSPMDEAPQYLSQATVLSSPICLHSLPVI
jgi:hypothetical protein